MQVPEATCVVGFAWGQLSALPREPVCRGEVGGFDGKASSGPWSQPKGLIPNVLIGRGGWGLVLRRAFAGLCELLILFMGFCLFLCLVVIFIAFGVMPRPGAAMLILDHVCSWY